MIFLVYSVNILNYIDWFFNVEPMVHYQGKLHLVRMQFSFLYTVRFILLIYF